MTSSPTTDTLGLHYIDNSHRRAVREQESARSAAHFSGLGGRRLAAGLAIAAAVLSFAQLVRFIVQPVPLPMPELAIAAWVVLAATAIIAIITLRIYNTSLPWWSLMILYAGVASTVALDIAATWGLLFLAISPTAGIAAVVCITPLAALRGATEVTIATSVLTLGLVAASVLQIDAAGGRTMAGACIALAGGLTPLLGVLVVDRFRRMVRKDIDLVLVQSTIGMPTTAVGFYASEELARLDSDAEAFLSAIGSGQVALPLQAGQAAKASELAGQLRLRLIEGRTETWLRHAVEESEFLRHSVTIDDEDALAGQLSDSQRDGLLTALWLLVSNHARADAPVVNVAFSILVSAQDSNEVGAKPTLSIVFSGFTSRDIDSSVWQALEPVGPSRERRVAGQKQIFVRCMPEDARGAARAR